MPPFVERHSVRWLRDVSGYWPSCIILRQAFTLANLPVPICFLSVEHEHFQFTEGGDWSVRQAPRRWTRPRYPTRLSWEAILPHQTLTAGSRTSPDIVSKGMYLYFSLARIFAGCEIPFVKLPNSLRTQMRIPFVKLPNSLRENDIYLSQVSEYSFFTYPDP